MLKTTEFFSVARLNISVTTNFWKGGQTHSFPVLIREALQREGEIERRIQAARGAFRLFYFK